MSTMLKFIDGKMITYQVAKLVDPYDDVLHTPTKLFDFQDEKLDAAELAYTLSETIENYEGMGLSANQIGIPYRVCAINMKDKIWILFNPVFTFKSAEQSALKEGCLSFPGLYLKIPRSDYVTVKFQAINGEYLEHTFTELSAVCVQHEIDHLDGICYTKRVSPIVLEREKAKVKANMKKMKRMAAEQAEKNAAYLTN